MTPDFSNLGQLHDLCSAHQVGYSVHYDESCHQFYVTINSAAPSERFIGRNHGDLADSVEVAIQFILNGFTEGPWCSPK